MGVLDMILDKVRQADRERFRQKVEVMEKDKKGNTRALGFADIEDVLEDKEERFLQFTSVGAQISEVQEPQEVKSTGEPLSQDVFDKFIQSIKG